VAPGPVETPAWMAEGGLADQIARRSGSTRDEVLTATRGGSPLGRMGREDEIAAVIVFLCSVRASDVAGAAWSVDGGTVQSII
jgi:3-oxoacyl-[acyl-carrier protein] reductase